MFQKILIANRGEIALRILRTAKEMGIKTVIVHSTTDEESMPVMLADESVCIGGASPKESYLNMKSVISAAILTGADAIHPGVGFLSENEDFAKMVEEHGIKFIGPSPEHIRMMGDKITAKKTIQKFGIPIIYGSSSSVDSADDASKFAKKIGYPVLIKARSGGGGKGMKVANNENELLSSYRLARIEAKANFGNDEVYMERYLSGPRHIELQILADNFGNVLSLGERDCSIQRNHQKIWEEAPATGLTEKFREKITTVVVKAIKKMGYVGVGTVELLVENDSFFFMEMNTRIQVEHTITEMVTGFDLIKEQILVASGEKLKISQKDVKICGHAIECRINAENPISFAPSPGLITRYLPPGGLGVRVDSHIYEGYKVPPYYDSMIGKLIIYAKTRDECLKKVLRALDEFVINGVSTLIPLHKKLAQMEEIINGNFNIHSLTKNLDRITNEISEKIITKENTNK